MRSNQWGSDLARGGEGWFAQLPGMSELLLASGPEPFREDLLCTLLTLSVGDERERVYLMSGLDLWLIMLSDNDRTFLNLKIPTFQQTNFSNLNLRTEGFLTMIQQVLLQILTLDKQGNRSAIEWLQHLLTHCARTFAPQRMTLAMHLKSHWMMDGSDLS